jgi:hypothetical protein
MELAKNKIIAFGPAVIAFALCTLGVLNTA